MGSFKNLLDSNINIHMYMTGTEKGEMYIHDTLRSVHQVNIESVYEVKTKKDFNNMLELIPIEPYTSGRWLFEIEFARLSSLIESNKQLFDIETSCFSFKTEKYRDFLKAKEILGRKCNELYLPIIRSNDIFTLFSGYGLSEKVISFISSSYSRDPESVFELREYIQQGSEVVTQRDVVRLVGASSGSVNSLIMLLLSKKPSTAKGIKKVLKSRLQMGTDLCDAYGVSSFRNFLNASVYDMLQLKILYMEGVVYNRISDLPKGFDENRLSKYTFYLDRIKHEVSYSRLLKLYLLLQKSYNLRWRSITNYIQFLYEWYEEVVIDGAVS